MKFGKKKKAESSGIAERILSRLFRKKDETTWKTEQPVKPASEKSDLETLVVADKVNMESEVTGAEATESSEPHEVEEPETGNGVSFTVDSRYDENGFDCAGFSQQYYRTAVDSLLNRVCKAGKQMQAGNYEYAVFGAKTAAESAAKILLCHNGYATGRMEEDIDDCRRYGLITDEMAGRLHGVRLLGNFNGHSFYAPENLTHGQAYFAIMQTLDFISELEIQLLWPEPLPELSAEWAREPVTLETVMSDNN